MYLLYKESPTKARFLIYLEHDHDLEQYKKNNYNYILTRIDDDCGKFIESVLNPITYDGHDIHRRVSRLYLLYER